MRLNLGHIGKWLVVAVAIIVVTGCGPRAYREPEMQRPEEGFEKTTMSMRINLRASGGGDTSDEMMHTLRVVIIAAGGYVEQNAYIDFNAGLEKYTTARFKVKSNETKTILLVANEESAVITLPDGRKVTAKEWLNTLDAAAGVLVDMNRIKAITMERADNFDENGRFRNGDGYIPMSAIHTYDVGNGPEYSGTFYIHRTAAKYTFRVKCQGSDADHNLTGVKISNVARTQYFFPNAVYQPTTPPQAILKEYFFPDVAGEELTFPEDYTFAAGNTDEYVEFGPYYLPEGAVLTGKEAYSISLTMDGYTYPWTELKPEEIDGVAISNPVEMKDLPRNTSIVVNINTLNPQDINVKYTVCPWNDATVDIPSFD